MRELEPVEHSVVGVVSPARSTARHGVAQEPNRVPRRVLVGEVGQVIESVEHPGKHPGEYHQP
jgi:hypothetical protein